MMATPPAWTDGDDVSIVVIARNEERRIVRCLESIARLTTAPGEVLVVDNDSTDATAERAWTASRGLDCSFRVIAERTRGIPNARTTGARAARGRIVAFLDADCEAPADFLARINAGFRDTDAAAVTGRYVLEGSDPRIAGYRERGWASTFGWDRPRQLLDRPDGYVGMTVGGASAFRRECLESVGWFDPQYGSADDIAVSLKLYGRGYRILLDPGLRVRHHIDTRARSILRKDIAYGRDAARLMRDMLRQRFVIDWKAYRRIGGHFAAWLRTRDGYDLFESRRRAVLKLAIAWEGLRSGRVYL